MDSRSPNSREIGSLCSQCPVYRYIDLHVADRSRDSSFVRDCSTTPIKSIVDDWISHNDGSLITCPNVQIQTTQGYSLISQITVMKGWLLLCHGGNLSILGTWFAGAVVSGLFLWYLGYRAHRGETSSERAVWPPRWYRWIAGRPNQEKLDVYALNTQVMAVQIFLWQNIVAIMRLLGINEPLVSTTLWLLVFLFTTTLSFIVLTVRYKRPKHIS